MATVVIYHIPGNGRSQMIANAMAIGVARHGHRIERRSTDEYLGPEGDYAVFYGFIKPLQMAMKQYSQLGGAVYVDLGYWGREHGGARGGYHKISVNGRHPTLYFQRRKHDGTRAQGLRINAKPWRKGGKHILLAGMGPKAAWVEGFQVEEWELRTVEVLRTVTDRPILYRPKPSFKQARPLPGTSFSDPVRDDLQSALRGCHAIVTHHSNVAVDALVDGLPSFCREGVALPLSSSDFASVEAPVYPDGREQWINDVSWTQFNVAEMQSGLAWRHLKDEGLVP